MTSSKLARVTAAAFATGIATLALAAPVQAQQVTNPDGGRPGTVVIQTPAPAPTSAGWQFEQVAVGAAGGLALAGVGIAATAGLRRHGGHYARPA